MTSSPIVFSSGPVIPRDVNTNSSIVIGGSQYTKSNLGADITGFAAVIPADGVINNAELTTNVLYNPFQSVTGLIYAAILLISPASSEDIPGNDGYGSPTGFNPSIAFDPVVPNQFRTPTGIFNSSTGAGPPFSVSQGDRLAVQIICENNINQIFLSKLSFTVTVLYSASE